MDFKYELKQKGKARFKLIRNKDGSKDFVGTVYYTLTIDNQKRLLTGRGVAHCEVGDTFVYGGGRLLVEARFMKDLYNKVENQVIAFLAEQEGMGKAIRDLVANNVVIQF